MVKHGPGGQLNDTFAALADPTRRAIVGALATGTHTISDLAGPLPMSLVAVSKHISVLERAGLAARTRSGRSQLCTLTAAPLRDAAAWLDTYRRFWTQQLDALEHHLTSEDG